MTDVFTEEKRSWVMSRIKAKDTKMEMSFRKLLWSNGLRYRKHYKKLPGKPDIVFASKRVAIFLDSHFWHGYEWEKLKRKLKNDYWKWKIKYNIERDKKNNKELNKMGWKVIRFWEHEIKENPEKCLEKIKKFL